MLTELVTRPISAVVALVELPLTMRRSLEQANDLMETSRRQLEQMQRQTDNALDQAERMNELLGRVVRLTEPIEKAQRGGEYAAGIAKRVIFGEDERAIGDADEVEIVEEVVEVEEVVDDADEGTDRDGDGSMRAAPNRQPPAE